MDHRTDTLMEVEDQNVLEEAFDICTGPRSESYGHPYYNYVTIRKMWSAITGVELTYDQCVFMMIAMKMGRQLTRHSQDNLVDIAGYVWVLDAVRTMAKEVEGDEGHPASQARSR